MDPHNPQCPEISSILPTLGYREPYLKLDFLSFDLDSSDFKIHSNSGYIALGEDIVGKSH